MRKKWLWAVVSVLCLAAIFVGCTHTAEYDVTYMNGTKVFYSAKVEEGAALPVPTMDPTKEEDDTYTYTFKGWSLTENGEIVDLASVTVTEAMTFYAVFEQKPVYTVTFVDWDGETVLSEQKVEAGKAATAPEVPAREGYTFTGWDKQFTNITGRTKITAQYSINSYTLTLGVLGKEQTKAVEYKGSLDISAPTTPDGLKFDGWYVQEEGSAPELLTEKYPNGMPAADVSAYAQFVIDWDGIALDTGDNTVYGGRASVTLPEYENITYTCRWHDESRGENFIYKSTGEQNIKVTVTVVYKNESDYIYSETQTFEEKINVKKAPLSIIVSSDKIKYTYGETPETRVQYSGFVLGEDASDLTGTLSVSFTKDGETVNAPFTAAGEYVGKASGVSSQNYEITFRDAEFTVEKATIKVTLSAEEESVVYGGAYPVKVSYSGFQFGEDAHVIKGTLVFSYMKDGSPLSGIADIKNVGNYAVTATSGLSADNYTFDYASEGSASFEIISKDLTVTISADKPVYTYGEVPKFSAQYDGLIEGDNEGMLGTLTYVYMKDGASVNEAKNAGAYTVTAEGLSNANYNIKYAYGGGQSLSFTINPKALTATITIDDTFAYAEEISPEYKIEGFEFGENESVLGDIYVAFMQKGEEVNGYLPVGAYAAELKGFASENYTLDADAAAESFSVTQREVTIAASENITGAAWRKDSFSFGLPEDIGFTGVLKLNVTEEKTYEANGESLEGTGFEWESGPVFTYNKTDVTENFKIKYALSISYAEGQFAYTKPENYSTPYAGSDITVKTVNVTDPAEGVTVEYSLNSGAYSTTVPVVKDVGTYTVNYRISAEYYDTQTGSYTVTVTKAQNSITVNGQIPEFTYTGAEQTVDYKEFLTAAFGADTMNVSEGVNTFTNVPEGGKLTFTVAIAGTENYEGAEYIVTVTVKKADYKAEDVPEALATDAVFVRQEGKTLAEIDLNEFFTWADSATELKGGGAFDAYYCADAVNYNPYKVSVTVNTRKQYVKVFIDGAQLPAESSVKITDVASSAFADGNFGKFVLKARGETASFASENLAALYALDNGGFNKDTGSTYIITFAENAENIYYLPIFTTDEDYYNSDVFVPEDGSAQGDSTYVAKLKITSVQLESDAANLYTIEDALNKAESGTVIITADTAFAAAGTYSGDGYYTVKSGVTLLVPYDGEYATNVDNKTTQAFVPVADQGFVKLTIVNGISLIVQGQANLIVNALRVTYSGSTGHIYAGNYGELEVEKNASIIIKSEASFYSLGFSYGGGEVIVESAANVYELFDMVGWKGGSISLDLNKETFPMNQYTLSSLIVKTKIMHGANYYAKVFVTAAGTSTEDVNVLFISNSDEAFIQLNSGYIYKWIDESSGRVHFEIYGDMTFNNMTITIVVKLLGFIPISYTIKTDGVQVPIPGHFSITIANGATVTIPNNVQIKLLPGMQLTVMNGAVLNIQSGGALYSYGANGVEYIEGDVTEWRDGNNSFTYPHANLSGVYRQKPDFDYKNITPTTIRIEGTLNIEDGALCAAEFSGGSGGLIQVKGASLQGILIEDNCSYDKETSSSVYGVFKTQITAMLLNDNGSTVAMVTGTTYTYTGGVWA